MRYFQIMKTPIAGRHFCLEEEDGCLVAANFFYLEESGALPHWIKEEEHQPGSYEECKTPLLIETIRQLEEYFAGIRKAFDIPLSMKGTEFQMEDWKALCTIPYGETRTYGQIAAQIGRPKASRAVGMANHNNPISVIVPCHRVIGVGGKLVGYGGGLDVKEALLTLENHG